MWQAKLKSISENPVPNDTAFLKVEFTKDDRVITKDLKINANNVQNEADIQIIIDQQIEQLENFDKIKDSLTEQVDEVLGGQ